MKVAVVALTLATAVLAQSSSSTSSAPAPSGMPTGISTPCYNYLTALNNNANVNKCLTAIINATDSFNPTTSGSSAPNSAAVTAALGNICTSNVAACDPAPIRQALTDFYAACGTELLGNSGIGTDGNKQVIELYDFLYLITPMKQAICTKGDDGKYCVMKATGPAASGSSSAAAQSSGAASNSAAPSSSGSATPSGSSSSSSTSSAPTTSATHAKRNLFPLAAHELVKRSPAHTNLLRRQASNTTQQALTDDAPHADAYRQSGLPYLFITPNTTDICNTCTKKIIAAYIDFETVTPYAIGIPNSPLLSGQVALWEKMKTCGGEFINSVLNGTAAQPTSGALATRTMSLGGIALAVVGAAAAVMI